ncbi:hypothetical protein OHC33_009036 [Knufia fluminis]|uniref:Uncharacterized protein n=1 Tax=Knufia fluminis TaxID=191047 RepID=A0AAN8I531_9EURO|nr:hypothetical protein OHC33_009036 [Knufia fluminis]
MVLDAPLPPVKQAVPEVSWWRPVTVSWLVLVFTFTLAAAGITTLEVIQRISDAGRGFAALPLRASTWETAYTRLIPALILLLVATLFNCVDFNIMLLSPYHKMKTSISKQEMMSRSPISLAPPIALWHAVRNNYWAAVASSSAALLGSVMTIVVSGLYDIRTLHDPLVFQMVASDGLQPFWRDSAVNDTGAALLSSLTENLNFPYPAGTFFEIAFPTLQLPDGISSLGNSTVTAEVPAWRANLACTVLPQSNVSVAPSPTRFQNVVTINATYGLPATCSRGGGPNGTEATLEFANTFTFPTEQNSTYIGKLLDLHVGPYDPVLGDSQGELEPIAMEDNPLGCPSLALIYGFANLAPSSTPSESSDAVFVEVCYQQLQTLQAAFSFQDSSLTVDASNPPRVNESSVQYAVVNDDKLAYSDDPLKATSFQFRPENHFKDRFVVFNTTNDNPYSAIASSRPPVDSFFQGVLFGRAPVPLTSLQLKTDDQLAQVRQGILSFYRRYMAQVISLNMRVAVSDDAINSQPNVEGHAPTAVPRRRVFQNNTSKLVLQSMLAFMLVCGLFATCTVKMHKLLPASANPCTIWGQMSLWAGSSLCDNEHTRGQWHSVDRAAILAEQSGHASSKHEGRRFKLGWWYSLSGDRRYGLDVVEEK